MFSNVTVVVLSALVIIFVFQNIEIVEVRFLLWKLTLSRALLILGTFLVGMLTGALLRRPKRK